MGIKKIIFYIIATLLSLSIAFILFVSSMEFYLRLKNRQNNERAIHLSKEIFINDPNGFGYRLLPNRQYRVKGREFNFLIKSNSKGFRDREYSYNVPSGVKRIIIVGDSFTFGHGVENSETYPKELERKLAEEGKYEVINAGMPGNSLVDYIDFIKEIKDIYRADYIMIGLHGGDITESMQSSVEIEDGVISGMPIRVSERLRRPLFIEVKDYLRYHLLSYGFLVDLIKRNAFLSKLALKLKLINSLDKTCTINDEFSNPETLEFLGRELHEFAIIAQQSNAMPALFFIPDKWYVAPRRFYSSGGDRLSYISGILDKMCREEGVIFIDTSTLRDYHDADSILYFDYDYHFNKTGNEVFGDVLFSKIDESALFDR